MSRTTHVVAGVIRHGDWILVSQRPPGKNLAGMWEFPGGKVIAGESESDALQRELSEELGLVQLQVGRCLDTVHDRQPHHTLVLSFYEVYLPLVPEQYPLGTAGHTGSEGQRVDWRRIRDLRSADFPPANRGVLRTLGGQA